MDLGTFLLIFAVVACVYMACNIGANDVANAMGTSVGARSLTFRQAVLVAAVAEFAGALLVGGHVSDTVRKGMVDPALFADEPMDLVFGMIASLVAAAIWLNIASYLGWPVSTTHSIIGAVVGFGLVARGLVAVQWMKVGSIVLSWIVSPLMGGIVAFLIFRFITVKIFDKHNAVAAAKRVVPYLVFLVFVILANSMMYKGLKNLHLNLDFTRALTLSLLVGAVAYLIARMLVNKVTPPPTDDIHQQFQTTEHVFKYLQIITAFYVAFAHGANDVANAVGPLAAVVAILDSGAVHMKVEMPIWILGMGGTGIVFGLLIWGARVMETVGKRITEITPSRGFAAEFGAATVVLICSKMGLPISTTHTLVGSVIGVGMARGLASLNLNIIRQIIVSWFATVPFTAVLSMMVYEIFKMTLG
ncbi:inorganic phosphate transporter [Nitrospina watsonii]|uniref:Phosphate transporter n=1 Tax=Nitrospina watsonii TaxID=1323948 RepID=A0ABM9HFN8_9BACT|nr:inorganic phosphate transporter [Nitrospina watsonii]CAI2718850.1 Phosphate transporter [Nitrospina watsonii]